MPRRRPTSVVVSEWPAALRFVIRAAELECPRGHADALLELTALAMRKIPARGIFDPTVRGEHELFAAIEAVAHAHLELTEARRDWRDALETAALDLEKRDRVEMAALHVQTISDSAYFYAGLAFGMAFTSGYRS